jgi:hypothetical protein
MYVSHRSHTREERAAAQVRSAGPKKPGVRLTERLRLYSCIPCRAAQLRLGWRGGGGYRGREEAESEEEEANGEEGEGDSSMQRLRWRETVT